MEYLACPACAGQLTLLAGASEGDEVMEGSLQCARCAARYPVRGGVPRFRTEALAGMQARTAEAFGWEWKKFDDVAVHHERQFLDWMAPATPAWFTGNVVVEAGCGKGRHTRLAAGYGARAVLGVDLSDAVDVAFPSIRHLPNAHVIQADLLRLPLRRRCADRAFSVGVLHHLPDPREGFTALCRSVRPGGEVSIWVYGREGNGWIAHLVSPARRLVTSRMPPSALYWLAGALALPLHAALRLLYAPARRGPLAWARPALFYYPYLSYISGFPFREVHHIVHDHLAAPVAHYLSRADVESWYREAGARDVEVAWHNQNSWRGRGLMPSSKGT